ncbi:MAG: rRNA maturation RNase YbeY [Eubacteriales bacterium]|nr:rRNA maturation RNase YbeY [Eubacteriales bacterium]
MKGLNTLMHVQFNNRQRKHPVLDFEKIITMVFTEALSREEIAKKLRAKGLRPEIAVSFVSPATIRNINRETRMIHRVTDVLSFPMLDMSDGLLKQKLTSTDYSWDDAMQPMLFLGDLVICLERAKQQAQEFNHSIEREVGFLAVHGLLHLLGYDHDTDLREALMQKRQRNYLDAIGLSR